MTAPLMPRATAVWLVENTTLTFRQIAVFCEIHELEIQAMADGDVSGNIRGLSPVDNGQLTWDEIHRCEADKKANLQASEMERNVKLRNLKAKKVLSPSQRQDKPNAIAWILKNYPEIKDTLICKLIGTTKNTINAIRDGSHKDMSVIRPKNSLKTFSSRLEMPPPPISSPASTNSGTAMMGNESTPVIICCATYESDSRPFSTTAPNDAAPIATPTGTCNMISRNIPPKRIRLAISAPPYSLCGIQAPVSGVLM